jgi:hypothetical protein
MRKKTLKKRSKIKCQEIVSARVDITDYGLDLPGAPSLAQMITRVLQLNP